MDTGNIILTREEFIRRALFTKEQLPVGQDLAKSLLSSTKHPVFSEPTPNGWLVIDNQTGKILAEKIRIIDDKVRKMNESRLTKGLIGGRPKLDDLQGTPAQVKARLAKRRSRERLRNETQ